MESPKVYRSVQRFAVVVETTNGPEDLKALEAWAQDRVLNATRSPRANQCIAIGALNDKGQVIRSATHGTPQGDTNDIIEDLFDVKGHQ